MQDIRLIQSDDSTTVKCDVREALSEFAEIKNICS